MGNDLNYAYERCDEIKETVVETEDYLSNHRVYTSLQEIGESIARSFKVASLDRFSLYRANIYPLVNVRQGKLAELCQGCPVIHVTREGSRVVNASGDADDLLMLQDIISQKMLTSGR